MKRFFFRIALGYLILLLFLILISALGGFSSGLQLNAEQILEPPSMKYWFGTDSLGRDLFARVLDGGKVSLFVGVACALLSLAFGSVYGAVAGWNEGWVDRVLMRACDILMALPSFILVAVIVLTLQLILPIEDVFIKSILSLCLGIFSTHWMGLARMARGIVRELRHRPFVEAATVMGGGPSHILFRHILPHAGGTLLIVMALQIPGNIVYESFMSFIGLGIHPPHTSWGILVRDGWKTLSSFPHLILFPSFVLFMTVWSLHVLLDQFKKTRRL